MESIVLCIPGPWEDKSELAASIARIDYGYLMLGDILMHHASKRHWQVSLQPCDSRELEVFQAAVQGSMTPKDQEALVKASSVVFLTGEQPSIAAARDSMAAAIQFLSIGGLGVKVETTGIAHGAERWRELLTSAQLFDLYKAYTTLAPGDTHSSFGMKNFGLADSCVPATLSPAAAAGLINQFCFFLMNEAPDVRHGQKFSLSPDSPQYRLRLEKDTTYPEGDTFHNPFGRWHLDAM